MKTLFSVTFNEEELPHFCAAESEDEASNSASGYATDHGLSISDELVVKREGIHPDFEDCKRLYSLQNNPHDPIAGLGGALFGSTGFEWDAVSHSPPDRIWTLIDDEGIWWISPGVHFVNQLGFLLTNEQRIADEPDYLYE